MGLVSLLNVGETCVFASVTVSAHLRERSQLGAWSWRCLHRAGSGAQMEVVALAGGGTGRGHSCGGWTWPPGSRVLLCSAHIDDSIAFRAAGLFFYVQT